MGQRACAVEEMVNGHFKTNIGVEQNRLQELHRRYSFKLDD